jgi:hypothetical protein
METSELPRKEGRWGMGAEVVTAAGIQALSRLFPGWRVWADNDTSWHAYRRGGYVQHRSAGAPAFSVHAGSPAELAGLLFWQDAVDAYGPFACSGV